MCGASARARVCDVIGRRATCRAGKRTSRCCRVRILAPVANGRLSRRRHDYRLARIDAAILLAAVLRNVSRVCPDRFRPREKRRTKRGRARFSRPEFNRIASDLPGHGVRACCVSKRCADVVAHAAQGLGWTSAKIPPAGDTSSRPLTNRFSLPTRTRTCTYTHTNGAHAYEIKSP